MSDTTLPHVFGSAAGGRLRLHVGHLPHLAFFLIVAGSAARMVEIDNPRCLWMLSLTGVLALGYGGGLVFWEQLGRWRTAWLGALLLVWLLLVHTAPASLATAFSWCAVPLACVAAGTLGRRASIAAVAVITGLLVAIHVRNAGAFQPDLVLAPIAAVWATLALYRVQQDDAAARQVLIDELRETRADLALREHEAGTSAERARIAREIHDTLAQELAGSRLLLQAAEREWWRDPAKALARVHAVTESLGENLVETRRIIDDLTPPALDTQGLDAALRELCVRAQRSGTAHGVVFRTDAGLGSAPEAPETASTLLRVAQGALANVRDHACAANVVVTLDRLDGLVTLQICDDGIGFAPDRTTSAPGRGFGLAAIRDRLRAYGGTVLVDSAPGRGTTLTATLPLTPAGVPAHPRLVPVAG